MDLWISWALRVGVLLSALLVLLGGFWYLGVHGRDPVALRSTSPFAWSLSLEPLGLMQLGLLVLILTPVARVVLSVFLFLEEEDRTFALITLWVLLVLLASLLGWL